MTGLDESYFLSPEYVQNSDTMRMLARLLSTADSIIGYQELDTSLFLMFTELESLVRAFSVAKERIPTVVDYRVDVNVRKRISDKFRVHAKQSEGVTENVAAYIDYLADQLDH